MSVQHLNEVQRQLILKLRAAFPDIGDQVVMTTDMSYSEDGVLVVNQEELPILVLDGPTTERNSLFTSNAKPTRRHGPLLPDGVTPSLYTAHTAEDAVDLFYQVQLLHNHTGAFTDLTTRVYAYFMNGRNVTAEKCPGEPGEGSNTYEIDLIEKFASGNIVNRSNLKETTGRLIVRGVQVSDGEIFREGRVADEVVLLDSQKLN